MNPEILMQIDKLTRVEKLRLLQFLIEDLIAEETRRQRSGWPEDYFTQTYGSLKDDAIEISD